MTDWPDNASLRRAQSLTVRRRRGTVTPTLVPMTPNHPYRAFEDGPTWRAIDAALRALEANDDVTLRTARPYVLGPLCQALSGSESVGTAPPDLLREAEGWAAVQAIEDPVVRNLVTVVFGAARLRTVRQVGESEAGWRARFPAADFDMVFLVRAVEAALRDTALVRALLDGQSIERAAGWDL